MIKLEVKAEQPEDLDTVQPFLDFPVAAIRSPPIRVERNNLIRISVLAKRMFPSASGAGGVIVRDSIGGEHFQYRTSAPIAEFTRILLFRKAPADGTFTVTLGLAGTARPSSTTCESKSSSTTTAPRRRTWSSARAGPGDAIAQASGPVTASGRRAAGREQSTASIALFALDCIPIHHMLLIET